MLERQTVLRRRQFPYSRTSARSRRYIAPLTQVRISSWLILNGRRISYLGQYDEEAEMRVLVAGDRGYIGAVLVPFVRAAGHEVVGLDVG